MITRLNVLIEKELYNKIKTKTEKEGRTVSSVVRILLQYYLEDKIKIGE
jgi:hypothetical protein